MYPGLGCPLIGNDFHIEIQVVNTEARVCQEEGECDHYLLVIWALQPWIKQSSIHQHATPPQRRLFSKARAPPNCQLGVFSFMPRPPIYHIFISHWYKRSLYSEGWCRYTCKQSQITWGCFPTFSFDIFWDKVISTSQRCCFMHDYIVLHSVWRDRSRTWKTYGTLLWNGLVKGEREWAWGIRRSLCSTCATL